MEQKVHDSLTTVQSTSSCENTQSKTDDKYNSDDSSQQCTETHAYVMHPNNANAISLSTTPPSSSSPSSSFSPVEPSPKNEQQLQIMKKSNEIITDKFDAIRTNIASQNLEITNNLVQVREKNEKLRFKDRCTQITRRNEVNLDIDCCDIEEFHEKSISAKAKQPIHSSFLPMHQICSKRAKLEESSVYSDILVYKKQPLLAKEISLLQTSRNSVIFRYSVNKLDIDFMPIYNFAKSNATGILYSVGLSSDIIDLKSSLQPNIILLEPEYSLSIVENVEIYHRFLNKGYNRISEKGNWELSVPLVKNREPPLDFSMSSDCHVNLHNWIESEVEKKNIDELEQNRSSLLMLEPLLLMPSERIVKGKKIYQKNRLAKSEHLKLIRIVIAYSLSFLILVSITFYLVYFT